MSLLSRILSREPRIDNILTDDEMELRDYEANVYMAESGVAAGNKAEERSSAGNNIGLTSAGTGNINDGSNENTGAAAAAHITRTPPRSVWSGSGSRAAMKKSSCARKPKRFAS